MSATIRARGTRRAEAARGPVRRKGRAPLPSLAGPPPPRGRIAFVGADRQIWVSGADGEGSRQVTYSKVPGALARWGASRGTDGSSWPCWSPDGTWLACFQAEGADDDAAPSTVTATEVDGVEERMLVDLGGQQPIYAQWNPQGDRLAVLAQDRENLCLYTCRLGEVGKRRVVDQGVPLFFTWTPDGNRLLVHAGARATGQGRLVLREPDGGGDDRIFPESPGSFCTPMFVGQEAVVVVGATGGSSVCMSDAQGRELRHLATMEGLLAVVPSPAGDQIAIASAPRGESTPYQGVWLQPCDGGEMVRAVAEDCIAFFWDPPGTRIVYAVFDGARTAMRWKVVDLDSGRRRDLCAFWPSRDQLFYLHFFEQYARSHPTISPDGRRLVYCGHADPRSAADRTRPLVHLLDLDDAKAEPRVVAEGSFAVFSAS